jgi:hypothetical protein
MFEQIALKDARFESLKSNQTLLRQKMPELGSSYRYQVGKQHCNFAVFCYQVGNTIHFTS